MGQGICINMKIFKFDIDRVDIGKINKFSELENFISSCNDYEAILIDLKNIKFFNSSLCSIFTSILRKAKEEKYLNIEIDFDEKNSTVKKVFDTNGFFNEDKSNYINNIKDLNDTYIVVKKFEKNKFNEFLDYIRCSLVNRHFSNNILILLFQQLAEIFNNFQDHSDSKYLHIAGQFFPNKKHIDICLTDKGIGIANLIIRDKKLRNQLEAVKWAFEGQNTTREKFGGFGLKNLKKFIENNKGQLIIYCNRICYDVINDRHDIFDMGFLGTSIFIRLPMQ